MKTTQLITAAITLAISGAAFAQAGAAKPTSASAAVAMQAGTVTRAQVAAELDRARKNGEIRVSEADYGKMPSANAGKMTRAQVAAELERAQNNGEIRVSEADYAKTRASTSTTTRAQVMAEFYAAQKNGQIRVSESDYSVANIKSHNVK
jgi:hypothetical protein